jgi:hypothetical protein
MQALQASTSRDHRKFQTIRGKCTDARCPIYGRFTEGFETSDLKVAKSLIDKLM